MRLGVFMGGKRPFFLGGVSALKQSAFSTSSPMTLCMLACVVLCCVVLQLFATTAGATSQLYTMSLRLHDEIGGDDADGDGIVTPRSQLPALWLGASSLEGW